jgi:FAD/FMN-containing dehydrogenase
MLIGSKGCLAVVTECTLKIVPIQKYKQMCIFKTDNFEDGFNFMMALKYKFDGEIAGIDMIDPKLFVKFQNNLNEKIKNEDTYGILVYLHENSKEKVIIIMYHIN